MTNAIRAWHFLADTGFLRDGREPPPDGEWLVHEGRIEICRSGLHASRKARDALSYAPGSIVCRVECRGIEGVESDKFVCRERKIIWRADATKTLRHFARLCALDVIHRWDAPDVVVRYLRTGDEALKDAARDVARGAARGATRAAAWDAAWDAAWAAARDATWDTTREKQNRRLERMLLELGRKTRGGA